VLVASVDGTLAMYESRVPHEPVPRAPQLRGPLFAGWAKLAREGTKRGRVGPRRIRSKFDA